MEPLSAKYKNIAGVEEKINLYRYLRAGKRDYRYGKLVSKACGISGINVSAEDAKKVSLWRKWNW